jgi:hypothetical protein
MASQPQPPQRPTPPPPKPPQPQATQHPTPAARGTVPPTPPPVQPIGDQQALKTELDKAPKPEPPKVRTIADEQRERSAEIEKMGVEAYKRSIDQRDPKDIPGAVEGVRQPKPELEGATHR